MCDSSSAYGCVWWHQGTVEGGQIEVMVASRFVLGLHICDPG